MRGGGQTVGTSCLGKPPSEAFNTDTDHHHRHNLGGEVKVLSRIAVLATELTVGKRGVCILKTSFNQFSPLFPPGLLCKWKFLIPMVDFAPPPQPPYPVLLAKLCLSCSLYYDDIQLWRQNKQCHETMAVSLMKIRNQGVITNKSGSWDKIWRSSSFFCKNMNWT